MTSPSPTSSPSTAALANFEVRGARFRLDVADLSHPPATNPYFRLARRGYLYEPVMNYCLAQIISTETNPCFMDIGSSLGYYASFVAALIGDASRVHAVEADPFHAGRTARSCAASGYPDVTVHNVILSDVEQSVKADGRRGVVYDESADGAVTSITGDALCAERGIAPTIVKLDVHGCEGKVLLGMENVLREHVRFLLLELHDAFRLAEYSPGISRTRFMGFLEELGFSIFHVAGHQMPFNLVRDEGFTYRPWKNDVFYDRCTTITFMLASKTPDLASVLGPSVDDPRLF